MNFLIKILINGISAYYFVDFLPWWSVIFIPFLLIVSQPDLGTSLTVLFLGIFIY